MPNPKKHPSHKLHPSDEILKQLEDADWTEYHDGKFWQSPHDPKNFFSPPGAIVVEEAKKKKNPQDA